MPFHTSYFKFFHYNLLLYYFAYCSVLHFFVSDGV